MDGCRSTERFSVSSIGFYFQLTFISQQIAALYLLAHGTWKRRTALLNTGNQFSSLFKFTHSRKVGLVRVPRKTWA